MSEPPVDMQVTPIPTVPVTQLSLPHTDCGVQAGEEEQRGMRTRPMVPPHPGMGLGVAAKGRKKVANMAPVLETWGGEDSRRNVSS